MIPKAKDWQPYLSEPCGKLWTDSGFPMCAITDDPCMLGYRSTSKEDCPLGITTIKKPRWEVRFDRNKA